ncbi:AAA family ATPase [Streptomyces sp. Ru62]|uniref:AAA family ATPase n=1 Tax=Streptomyces sp. Ru62 TaxID=2080745 RepID=UPI0035BC20E1
MSWAVSVDSTIVRAHQHAAPGCAIAAAPPTERRGTRTSGYRPGHVVLIDEAGMANILLLGRVLADASAAGAVVRLLGDPHQLAAI